MLYTAGRVLTYCTVCVQRLATITDEAVYQTLQASDIQYGRWTGEDPSVRAVQRWVRSRRAT